MRPLAARLDPPSASSAPQKAKSRPGDGQRQQAEVSAGFQDTLRRSVPSGSRTQPCTEP